MAAVSNRLPALPAAPQALIRLTNINAYLRFKGRRRFKWTFKGKTGICLCNIPSIAVYLRL
jgi:hypothetical protein